MSTIRNFLIGAIGGLALLTSACDQEPSSTAPSAQHPPVSRSSYGHQRFGRTFGKILDTVKSRKDFRVYSGTIDSVFEEEHGGISSAVLSVAGEDTKVILQLGKGSYQVTDGVHDQSEVLSGLFDPQGEPLLRVNCQPGDKVTVVCWKKDHPVEESYLPVRAFGNYTEGYFMSSAELLRHLGLTGAGSTDRHIIVAGSEKKARGYMTMTTTNPKDRGIYPTKYFLIRSPSLSEALRESLLREFEENKGVQRD